MNKFKRKIVWYWANLVSRWHVLIDQMSKWLLVRAEKTRHENLRLWVERVIKILSRYNGKVDESEKEDQ